MSSASFQMSDVSPLTEIGRKRRTPSPVEYRSRPTSPCLTLLPSTQAEEPGVASLREAATWFRELSAQLPGDEALSMWAAEYVEMHAIRDEDYLLDEALLQYEVENG